MTDRNISKVVEAAAEATVTARTELVARIAEVLAEHRKKVSGKPWYLQGANRYFGDRPGTPYQTYVCKCGQWEGSNSDHEAHLADVLADVMGDVWDEGYDARDRHDFRYLPGCANPYRVSGDER